MKKPATTIVLPNRNSQNESAFSRGNATSGEPICSGMIRLPNAKNSGVANISSISVPCIVNSWLYCSGDRNCIPGRASSPRISMAIRPPMMKNMNEAVRYIRPMVLWSVVRRMLESREPLTATAAGLGRLTIGRGAIAVMPAPPSRAVPKPAAGHQLPPGPRAPLGACALGVCSPSASGMAIVAHRGAEGNPEAAAPVPNERGAVSPRRPRR